MSGKDAPAAPALPRSRYLTLSCADATSKESNADFVCSIPGGISMEAGQQFRALRAYVHDPGSDQAEAQGIVITETITTSIDIAYYVRNIAPAAQWITIQGEAWPPANPQTEIDPRYFFLTGGGVTTRPHINVITITVPPGVYTYQRLAELITEQTMAANTEPIDASIPANLQLNGTKTLRGYYQIKGQPARLFFTDFQNGKTATMNQGLYQASYVGSTLGLVVRYLQDQNRFALGWCGSPLVDQSGTPSFLRITAPLTAQPTFLSTATGIGVQSGGWGSRTEAGWGSTIWATLGFTWAQMNPAALPPGTPLPTSLPPDIIVSEPVVPPAAIGVGPGSSNFYDPGATDWHKTVRYIPVPDDVDYSGPVADNPPQKTARSQGYWVVEVDLQGAPTGWHDGLGRKKSSGVAVVDRSFSSGDTYVASDNPTHTVLTGFTTNSARVRIVDPATNLPDPTLGDKSTVVLELL